MTTSSLTALHQSVSDLRIELNGKRWPASAKATVLAAAFGVIGTMGAVALGAPV